MIHGASRAGFLLSRPCASRASLPLFPPIPVRYPLCSTPFLAFLMLYLAFCSAFHLCFPLSSLSKYPPYLPARYTFLLTPHYMFLLFWPSLYPCTIYLPSSSPSFLLCVMPILTLLHILLLSLPSVYLFLSQFHCFHRSHRMIYKSTEY